MEENIWVLRIIGSLILDCTKVKVYCGERDSWKVTFPAGAVALTSCACENWESQIICCSAMASCTGGLQDLSANTVVSQLATLELFVAPDQVVGGKLDNCFHVTWSVLLHYSNKWDTRKLLGCLTVCAPAQGRSSLPLNCGSSDFLGTSLVCVKDLAVYIYGNSAGHCGSGLQQPWQSRRTFQTAVPKPLGVEPPVNEQRENID